MQKCRGAGTPNYLLYTVTLFGDPAMRIPISGDVPQASTVTMTRSGGRVALNGPAVRLTLRNTATTVTKYSIWRSTRPYFDPDAPNCNCTKVGETTTGLSFVDDAITPIEDAANNYFYVARAQNSVGWSASSNHVGEFDFALRPGQ